MSILDIVMLHNGYETIGEVKALMLSEGKTGSVDIVRVGPSPGSCIINRRQYRTVGDFAECSFTSTDATTTCLLPPIQVIQALYMDNPQGIADYIAQPVRKRDDYSEMPPQDYLDPATRFAVAKYLLQVKN